MVLQLLVHPDHVARGNELVAVAVQETAWRKCWPDVAQGREEHEVAVAGRSAEPRHLPDLPRVARARHLRGRIHGDACRHPARHPGVPPAALQLGVEAAVAAGDEQGEVAPRGVALDADVVGRDVQALGVGAHPAHARLAVVQHGGPLRLSGQAILVAHADVARTAQSLGEGVQLTSVPQHPSAPVDDEHADAAAVRERWETGCLGGRAVDVAAELAAALARGPEDHILLDGSPETARGHRSTTRGRS
mmetsp:Transcript_51154/g.158475  ORF Transcript_51154/g.158475 Transcript_51154/m.158475 type:complete len:248 (-) Transcript_51154:29-772(-)